MLFTKQTTPQRRRFRRLSAAIAIVCSLALIAAACGDDDDDDPVAITPATEAPVTEAPTTTEAPPPAACGTDISSGEIMSDPIQSSPAAEVGLVFDLGGRGDLSFNDAAAAGLDRAKEDFDLDAQEASPNDDGSNREAILQLQADRAELVLGIGFLFADSLAKSCGGQPRHELRYR